jgi:hypothetical protein
MHGALRVLRMLDQTGEIHILDTALCFWNDLLDERVDTPLLFRLAFSLLFAYG